MELLQMINKDLLRLSTALFLISFLAMSSPTSVSAHPLKKIKAFWLAKPTPQQQTAITSLKTPQIPNHWVTHPAQTIAFKAEFPLATWWEAFPTLTGLRLLIPQALAANPTLQAITQQVAIAQQQAKLTQAGQLPQVGVGASYLQQQYGKNQFLFPLQKRTFSSFQTPLTLSYELDTWGINQNKSQQAKLEVLLATTQVQSAKIQLASLVASTYINQIRLQDLLTLQRTILKTHQQLLAHQQRLVQFKQAPADSLIAFQQNYKIAETQYQQLALALQLAQHQLGLLLGQTPAECLTLTPLSSADTLLGQAFPASVDGGSPSELVLRRPDVQAVELQLKQAGIEIAIARKEFLPSLKLTAATGLSSVGLNNLFKWSSLSSYIYPSLYQPLFTGGRLKAQLKIAQLTYQQLLKTYLGTLQTAFTEVEDALATVSANATVFQQVTQQTSLAQQAESRASKRLNVGIAGEIPVLQARLTHLSYRQATVQQTAQGLIDVVTLTKALGGGLPPLPTT
jgi:outer membrane protein, multidrug efflux system